MSVTEDLEKIATLYARRANDAKQKFNELCESLKALKTITDKRRKVGPGDKLPLEFLMQIPSGRDPLRAIHLIALGFDENPRRKYLNTTLSGLIRETATHDKNNGKREQFPNCVVTLNKGDGAAIIAFNGANGRRLDTIRSGPGFMFHEVTKNEKTKTAISFTVEDRNKPTHYYGFGCYFYYLIDAAIFRELIRMVDDFYRRKAERARDVTMLNVTCSFKANNGITMAKENVTLRCLIREDFSVAFAYFQEKGDTLTGLIGFPIGKNYDVDIVSKTTAHFECSKACDMNKKVEAATVFDITFQSQLDCQKFHRLLTIIRDVEDIPATIC